ncbi:MAG: beta-glucuronidase [Clostridiales bacterium]|nr:beta-glucuronidase [Clostridiales bacterium]
MNAYSELFPVNNELRHAELLDGLWRFEFDPKNAGEAGLWARNGLPESISMPVPASFADVFTDARSRDYCGDFWYETGFCVREVSPDRKYFIRFGSVTHTCKVFVNGLECAFHTGGFLPVVADITAAVVPGANRLTVKVNNELSETNIPCGTTVRRSDGSKRAMGYFDFFNYSGIHRSVYLIEQPKQAIRDYSIRYRLEGGDAYADYSVETDGEGEVSIAFIDAQGNTAARAEGKEGTLFIPSAHLWKVGNAYLYDAVIELKRNGQAIDRYTAKAGIRTVEIRGESILINGEKVYLKGFGKHEDSDILGHGFSYAVAKRDFECLKWMGANCFRTSHYPYADEWYRMADEEGFLIIDEVPAVGMMRSIANFLTAGRGEAKGFFAACPDLDELGKNHLAAIEEVIARDKNHPSVIAWSIFNEAETTTEAAEKYFAPLFEAARRLDPQKRPVTGVLEKSSSPDACRVYKMMDFVCLNRYYGWYVSGGEMEQAEGMLRAEMDAWQALGLDRPIVFTEFGADTLDSLHKLPGVMWSQEYQQEYMEMYFRVFDCYPCIQGELAWHFTDFQTGQGIMRVNGNKKGLFTRQRQPKAAAYTMRERWLNEK